MGNEPALSRQPLTQPPVAGPAVYVVVALIILGGGLFYYLQYVSNHAATGLTLTPEAKTYTRNLQLSDVTMKATESYLKQRVIEIDGKIGNTGDRALDLVEIYCTFRDGYGQVVLRKRVPIVSPRMGGLKPGETKSFRLPFDEIPPSWTQAMPQLVIAAIKFS